MQRYYKTILDAYGNPASGVSVLVTDASTGEAASLFNASDDALVATNGISNPIVTGASGRVAFAVTNGQYKLTFTGSGLTSYQETWISIFDGISATSNEFDTIVMNKATNKGILVDTADPTYPWHDIIGDVRPKTSGANTPVVAAIQGNIKAYKFVANDIIDFTFHIPHDYLPGSDIYLHVHTVHNGTNISGNMVWTHYTTYAKGHNQANFPAEVTNTITYNTTSITATPQYRHRIDEIALSSVGGSAALLNSSDIEVDGIIITRLVLTTLPTITAGSLFLLMADIHYQSTGIGTKQKAPPFWT